MGYRFALFCGLLVWGTGLYSQSLPPESGAFHCATRKSAQTRPEPKNLSLQGHSFNVLKYSLSLDLYQNFVSPFPANFKGRADVLLVADSALSTIVLNASTTSLIIDSIHGNGQTYNHSANKLTINLNQGLQPGDTALFCIFYRHNNLADGAFFTSNGMVFTDCEPEGARKWFPCYDRPSDKALTDISVRVPPGVLLGSNGRLADSTVVNDTLIYRWISADPVATYLVVLTGKTNYLLDVIYWHPPLQPQDSIPFRFYYQPGENPGPIKALLPPLCTFFSDIFCEHPFEKNGFATMNEQFTWGGMENQTLTSLCSNCWSEMLVVHEFAHQWFGDMITCGTWADIFLNEGFATYSELLWLEYQYGPGYYLSGLQSDAGYYFNGNPGTPISNPAWAISTPSPNVLFNYSITYAKGSCVLHMLRYVMGDSLFFQGLKNYANHPDLKYQSAIIQDFIAIMSQTAGQDLTWFFDQWIYEPNHPVYFNQYSIQENTQGDQTLSFQINQVQGGIYFQMPFDLKVYYPGGTDTLLHGFNVANGQLFSWSVPQVPDSVVFDPLKGIVLKQSSLIVAGQESRPNTGNLQFGWPFPNPSSSEGLRIPYTHANGEEIGVKLFNSTGQILYSETIIISGQGSIEFDKLPCSEGLYLVQFQIEDKTITRQVLLH